MADKTNSVDEIKQRFDPFEYHEWYADLNVGAYGVADYDIYCGSEGDTDPDSDEAYSVARVCDRETAELISHMPYDKVWDEIEHYFATPDDVVDHGSDDWLYELRAEADRRLDERYDGVADPGEICGECWAGAHQG